MRDTQRTGDAGRGENDSGYTLVELIVSMGVFMIFIVLMLGTTVALAQNASRTQLIAESSNGSLVVFGKLDRQARYADSINYPGAGPSGNRYIEFRTPGNSSASGVTTCTQWRFSPSLEKIDTRQWNDLPGATASLLATTLPNVIDDGGLTYPFALIPAGITASTAQQQLRMTLHVGNPSLNAGSQLSTTFVARNSSLQSPSNDADVTGQSAKPICALASGVRP